MIPVPIIPKGMSAEEWLRKHAGFWTNNVRVEAVPSKPSNSSVNEKK